MERHRGYISAALAHDAPVRRALIDACILDVGPQLRAVRHAVIRPVENEVEDIGIARIVAVEVQAPAILADPTPRHGQVAAVIVRKLNLADHHLAAVAHALDLLGLGLGSRQGRQEHCRQDGDDGDDDQQFDKGKGREARGVPG